MYNTTQSARRHTQTHIHTHTFILLYYTCMCACEWSIQHGRVVWYKANKTKTVHIRESFIVEYGSIRDDIQTYKEPILLHKYRLHKATIFLCAVQFRYTHTSKCTRSEREKISFPVTKKTESNQSVFQASPSNNTNSMKYKSRSIHISKT